MSKKTVTLLVLLVLTIALAATVTTAFAAKAAPNTGGTQTNGYGCGGGYAGICYSLMRDAKGNIVSKSVFEKNLDKAIADGTIAKADRAYFISMYDYCVANGGAAMGGGRGRGGCGGMRWTTPNN